MLLTLELSTQVPSILQCEGGRWRMSLEYSGGDWMILYWELDVLPTFKWIAGKEV